MTDSAEYLAFGDTGVDSLVFVDHLPQPDEKLWVEPAVDCPGGMAANAAAAYVGLGGSAGLVSTVGRDERGHIALADLEERGVDLRYVDRVEDPTFWTLALATPDGQRALVQFPTPAFGPIWKEIDYTILHGVRVVHCPAEQGTPTIELMSVARSQGTITSLDVEYPFNEIDYLKEVLPTVDLAFFNTEAALQLHSDPGRAASDARSMGAGTVVVTLGAEGAVLALRDGEILRLPGEKVNAVDANGAGDVFAATFAWARVRGWTDHEAGELANCAAAVSTTGRCRETIGDLNAIRTLAKGRQWAAKL